MSDEIVIDIKASGKVEALHFDSFDLKFLGRKKVTRASEIFYNEETEKWDVRLPGQDTPYPYARGFEGYDEAREYEVMWLQECRKQSVEPFSEHGQNVSMYCRSAFESLKGHDLVARRGAERD